MKTKLTPQITEEITKRLRVGCYAKMAAAAIGVPERSYYNWLERGQKAEKLAETGKKIPETEKIFWQFWQSVQQAEAEAEVTIVAMIFDQAKTDWRAGLEILARKYPERWAKKEYMDFKGSLEQQPNKGEEALKEFDEMFKDVPRAKLSEIISEMTGKLREAKNEALREKELKNKQLKALE
jgi:hypothetical protein